MTPVVKLALSEAEAQLILNALHALEPGGGRNAVSDLLARLEDQANMSRDDDAALRLISDADLTQI